MDDQLGLELSMKERAWLDSAPKIGLQLRLFKTSSNPICSQRQTWDAVIPLTMSIPRMRLLRMFGNMYKRLREA